MVVKRRQKTEAESWSQRAEDIKQKPEDRWQKAEDRGRTQKPESRSQKVNDRRQTTEGRSLKTKYRIQKTEGRCQKADDRKELIEKGSWENNDNLLWFQVYLPTLLADCPPSPLQTLSLHPRKQFRFFHRTCFNFFISQSKSPFFSGGRFAPFFVADNEARVGGEFNAFIKFFCCTLVVFYGQQEGGTAALFGSWGRGQPQTLLNGQEIGTTTTRPRFILGSRDGRYGLLIKLLIWTAFRFGFLGRDFRGRGESTRFCPGAVLLFGVI